MGLSRVIHYVHLFKKNFTRYLVHTLIEFNFTDNCFWDRHVICRPGITSITESVHSFNGDYPSIPEGTGSCGYLFHEIPGSTLQPNNEFINMEL